MNRYEGKKAIVTGAANGIGASIVEKLLQEGADVAAFDIDQETLEEKYAGRKGRVVCIPCDVSDAKSVQEAVGRAVEELGTIDVLFSNAGIIGRKSLLDTSLDEWNKVIAVNLTGTFLMDQAVLRYMVEHGIKGAVVNTSSVASMVVSANTGAYAASKGGVSQLTKFAALEMAPYGIRVNAFGPGTSATRLTEGTRFNPERNEKFLSNIPMGRYGEPEEAAATALFLGSEEASYITGVTLLEDGGFTLF